MGTSNFTAHQVNINHGTCPFCTLPQERVLFENHLALGFEDSHPVTLGHSLVIPKRHAVHLFELTSEEVSACVDLLGRM
jgi:diadenosine tetraphosphate (Ap4A) HIT family hydrolase